MSEVLGKGEDVTVREKRSFWDRFFGGSHELDANVSGTGAVEYVGDPMVNQDTSGTGEVSEY